MFVCVVGATLVAAASQIATAATAEYTMTGTITSGGSPVPGAEVTLTNGQSDVIVAAGRTDASGNYSLAVASYIEYNVTVSAEGYAVTSFQGGPGPENASLEPASLYGTVTDATSGNPAVGVAVNISPDAFGPEASEPAIGGAITDRNGYWAIPKGTFTPGDQYMIEYGSGSYQDQTTYDVTNDNVPYNIALLLDTGNNEATISGTVSGPSGGLDGAEVSAASTSGVFPEAGGTTQTSSSGAYTFNDLPPGTYAIEAAAAPGDWDNGVAYVNSDGSDTVTVADDQEVTGVNISFGSPAGPTETVSSTASATPATTTGAASPATPATAGATPGTTSVPSEPTSSSATDQNTTSKLSRAEVPKITGTVRVGETLTASSKDWPAGTRLSYRWYANAKAIPKASRPTLVLTAADLRKIITVKVTGDAAGQVPLTGTSPASQATAAGVLRTSRPKITGTARIGRVLRVKLGNWTRGTKFTYQWYADGEAIPRSTKPALRLVRTDRQKAITVKVQGRRAGYKPAGSTSPRSKPVL